MRAPGRPGYVGGAVARPPEDGSQSTSGSMCCVSSGLGCAAAGNGVNINGSINGIGCSEGFNYNCNNNLASGTGNTTVRSWTVPSPVQGAGGAIRSVCEFGASVMPLCTGGGTGALSDAQDSGVG